MIEYFLQKIEIKMLKTTSILSENFLNAVQNACTLHAELNRPAKNRRQQSRAWWPMAHVGNVHVSEIEHDSDSEIKRD